MCTNCAPLVADLFYTATKETSMTFYKHLKLHVTLSVKIGTNCAPLVADLFLYCYERDFHGS